MRPGHLTPDQRALLDRLLDEQAAAPAMPRVTPSGVSRAHVPLSFAQQRLWFFDQVEPGSPLYNLVGSARLGGALDRGILQRCLAEVVRRHEALRTTFYQDDGEPWARVDPAGPVDLPLVDLSMLAGPQSAAAVADRFRAEAHRSFDLSRDLMLRAVLLRTAADEHLLVICLHHIAADGWSLGVLLRELAELYRAFSSGAGSPLAELRVQYADFTMWQRSPQSVAAAQEHVAYWQEHLAGAPVVDLPTDRPRHELRSFAGDSVPLDLPADLVSGLRALGDRERATLYMVLLAGFTAVLSRWSGQTDVVVGASIAGRNRAEIADLIGFFVNTLPLRVKMTGEPSFRELLRRVRETCLAGYSHQDAPFEQVVAAVQPDRDPTAHTPLFRHTLVLHDSPHPRLRLPGLDIDVAPLYTDTAKFELRIELTPDAGGALRGLAEYSPELLRRDSAQRLVTGLRTLLTDAVADPGRPVGSLRLMDGAERDRLVGLLSGAGAVPAPGGCLHELFERRADQAPEAMAVVDGEVRLSYREVEARANQLARFLRGLGAGPEELVGVCLPRGAELVVALLGVLKSGAAYVPLDPAYPAARLGFMIQDCRAALVLTRSGVLGPGAVPAGPGRAGDPVARLVMLDEAAAAVAALPAARLGVPLTPANCAYVSYTSGSTGTPKGAVTEHGALVNLVCWLQDTYQLGPDDAALARTPLGFDVFTGEWAWPLTAGARVVMASPDGHRDPRYLAELICAERVTTCNVVPSLLRAFLAEPGAAACGTVLRRVMSGGEVLTPELAERFAEVLPGVQLHNIYGPTEAAIDVTAWPATGGDTTGWPGRVPIGTPITGARLYVLDDRLEPVPVGVPGELCIGGVPVSRGYLRRPGLTADRFVPDPFVPGLRLYLSGDKMRWLSGGALDFLGRLDDQLKIRGQRVEPAEVEAVIASYPAVGQSAVITSPDPAGGLRLAAYFTVAGPATGGPATGGPATGGPATGGPATGAMIDGLRAHLRERLPEYMIPATFVPLTAWPVGANGKLDRAGLPALQPGPAPAATGPRSGTERRLAGIWRDVLKVPHAGVHDDFFDLGGHSLLAARLVARVRAEFGVDLPLGSLLRGPTIAALASCLDAADAPLTPILRAARQPRRIRSEPEGEPL